MQSLFSGSSSSHESSSKRSESSTPLHSQSSGVKYPWERSESSHGSSSSGSSSRSEESSRNRTEESSSYNKEWNVEIRDSKYHDNSIPAAAARKDDDAPIIVEAEEVNCMIPQWKLQPACQRTAGAAPAPGALIPGRAWA